LDDDQGNHVATEKAENKDALSDPDNPHLWKVADGLWNAEFDHPYDGAYIAKLGTSFRATTKKPACHGRTKRGPHLDVCAFVNRVCGRRVNALVASNPRYDPMARDYDGFRHNA
jgi:hypothetical protein